MLSKIKQGPVEGQNNGAANNGLLGTVRTLQARDENEDDPEDVSDGEWNAGADGDIELDILIPTKGEENEVQDSEDDMFFDALEKLTSENFELESLTSANPKLENCTSKDITFGNFTLDNFTLEKFTLDDTVYPDTVDTEGDCSAGQCRGRQTASGFCCHLSARMFWLRFMDIPLELREKVYTEMFADLPNSIVVRSDLWPRKKCFPPIVPAICYTNKQVLNESIPALLRGRTIHIGAFPSFQILKRFLNQIPEKKVWKAITAAGFEHRYACWSVPDLVKKCPGLLTLHIELSAYPYVKRDEISRAIRLKLIADLQDDKRLRDTASVFKKLPNLRKLAIDSTDTQSLTRSLGCEPADVCNNFVAFMREKRDRWGATCKIEYRYLTPDHERPYKMGWGSEDDEV